MNVPPRQCSREGQTNIRNQGELDLVGRIRNEFEVEGKSDLAIPTGVYQFHDCSQLQSAKFEQTTNKFAARKQADIKKKVHIVQSTEITEITGSKKRNGHAQDFEAVAWDTYNLAPAEAKSCWTPQEGARVDCKRFKAEEALSKKAKLKRPEGMPKRPLSAYNLFFQQQRKEMLGDAASSFEITNQSKRKHRKSHGKIGFAEMAKQIGQKWQTLDSETKREFQEEAQRLKESYFESMKEYKSPSGKVERGEWEAEQEEHADSEQNDDALMLNSHEANDHVKVFDPPTLDPNISTASNGDQGSNSTVFSPTRSPKESINGSVPPLFRAVPPSGLAFPATGTLPQGPNIESSLRCLDATHAVRIAQASRRTSLLARLHENASFNSLAATDRVLQSHTAPLDLIQRYGRAALVTYPAVAPGLSPRRSLFAGVNQLYPQPPLTSLGASLSQSWMDPKTEAAEQLRQYLALSEQQRRVKSTLRRLELEAEAMLQSPSGIRWP